MLAPRTRSSAGGGADGDADEGAGGERADGATAAPPVPEFPATATAARQTLAATIEAANLDDGGLGVIMRRQC
jgi:hypothetical protein